MRGLVQQARHRWHGRQTAGRPSHASAVASVYWISWKTANSGDMTIPLNMKKNITFHEDFKLDVARAYWVSLPLRISSTPERSTSDFKARLCASPIFVPRISKRWSRKISAHCTENNEYACSGSTFTSIIKILALIDLFVTGTAIAYSGISRAR